MIVKQLYTGCLAEAAYFIASEGQAVIIDPLRETQPYLELASEHDVKIKYVMETHFHADFVSGHIDLARKSNAQVVFGPNAKPGYDAYIAEDGEEFKIGKVTLQVLHTPGHTMESTTYLLYDEEGKEHAIFTGDTLFIGDVGRPDLAVKSDMTKEDLAGTLYDSLHTKILPLPDDVIVYPGHGAGSACGKNMSSETTDSLGNQKRFNYALDPTLSREQFITAVTEGLAEPPAYFPENARINRMGYENFDHILEKGLTPLSVSDFQQIVQEQGALILDTRHHSVFPEEFIPGSIFIGIDGNFAPWVGALITPVDTPIVFLAPEGREEEVVTRLSRVGYENILGYLEGGIDAWKQAEEPLDQIPEVTPGEFAQMQDQNPDFLDVRKPNEYADGHVKGADNFPLDDINKNLDLLEKKPYYTHCLGGYRSLIAASILKKNGYSDIYNIKEGYRGLAEQEGLKIVKNELTEA